MTASTLTADQKMLKARANLILSRAFYATIMCSMELIKTDSVPTMATNGECIRWNPAFVDTLTFDEVLFVLCHEVLHNVFEHPSRLGSRNIEIFNHAADYVINDILTQDKCGTMPAGGLYNPQLVQAGGGTTDGVYRILEQNSSGGGGGGQGNGQGQSQGQPQGQGNGQGNAPMGGIGQDIQPAPGGANSAQAKTQQAKMRVMVGQARQAAKMCGQMGGALDRLLGDLLDPQVDWRSAVRSFIACRATDNVTWARPNRRFLAQGMYLPTRTGERVGTMAVAVDCSGSVSGKEVAEFAAEIAAIKADLRPKELHVVYFHSAVSKHDVFSEDDDLNIKPNGTGGTAFSPIFRHLAEQGVEPDHCVVLTDLVCHDFGPEPAYPVLWVSNHSKEAPWGEVLMMSNG